MVIASAGVASPSIRSTAVKSCPHAFSAHSSVVQRFSTLLCKPEQVAVDGSFSCVVCRSPYQAGYRVRVTPAYAVECPCNHYEEMLRPCDHAVAVIKKASTLAGLPHYQDLMDYRWLGETWNL